VQLNDPGVEAKPLPMPSHELQNAAPSVSPKVLMGHGVQVEEPAEERVPGGQGEQEEEPRVLVVPAAQLFRCCCCCC